MIKLSLLFRRKHGSALVIVMFVIAVVSLLGMNLIYISNNELEMTKRYLEHVKAFYIAEGGLERALAELKTNPDIESAHWQDILDKDQTLGAGCYRLSIDTSSPDVINITSTGKVGSTYRRLRIKVKLTARSPVYDYAIAVSKDVIIFEDIDIYGSIFSNGDAVLAAPHSANVTGDITAAGNAAGFSDAQVGGSIIAGADPVEIPVPNEDYYADKARSLGNYYEGNYYFDDRLSVNDIFFVYGDLAADGMQGSGTVFVKGNAQINGDISPEKGIILLIVTGNLRLNGTSAYDLIVYNTGSLDIGKNAVVNGCIVAGDLIIKNPITVNFDRGVVDKLPEDAPGAVVPGLKVISWRDESSL